MPYIDKKDRKKFQEGLNALPSALTAGELNYLLTCICQQYIDGQKFCYQTLNDVVGALEGCKIEFYRRIVAPYEGVKIASNGDVYTQSVKDKTVTPIKKK
jgi:hypothetical protein